MKKRIHGSENRSFMDWYAIVFFAKLQDYISLKIIDEFLIVIGTVTLFTAQVYCTRVQANAHREPVKESSSTESDIQFYAIIGTSDWISPASCSTAPEARNDILSQRRRQPPGTKDTPQRVA